MSEDTYLWVNGDDLIDFAPKSYSRNWRCFGKFL